MSDTSLFDTKIDPRKGLLRTLIKAATILLARLFVIKTFFFCLQTLLRSNLIGV